MRRILVFIIKFIIAALAIANLVALFLFRYQIPSSVKQLPVFRKAAAMIGGGQGDTVYSGSEKIADELINDDETGRTESTVNTEITEQTDSAHTGSGLQEERQPGEEREEETESLSAGTDSGKQGTGLHIDVPNAPLRYNGRGELDLLNGVFVVNADGTSAGDFTIEAEISAGTSRREKVIHYSADLPDGEVLEATRMLTLGTRYTGPSINLLGNVLFCAEGEDAQYAEKLRGSNLVQASDGFDNDITPEIKSRLRRYDAGIEEATILLSVTNIYGDTYETEVQVPMNKTGIVLRLITDHPEIEQGEVFDSLNYIEECYDAEGNDLRSNIKRDGTVDGNVPGEYHVTVYCFDKNGVKSIVRPMTVTVKAKEETESDAQT